MQRCRALGCKQDRTPICAAARDFLAGLILFIFVFLLAALDADSARPQTAAETAALTDAGQHGQSLTPGRMRSGALLVRHIEAGGPTGYAEAPLVGTDVEITVDGPIARMTVTQTFRNSGEKPTEGIYVFPLPKDAAVDTLAMQVGTRAIEGKMVSRAEAREMYGNMQLTAIGPRPVGPPGSNVFTSSVADIAPGETVLVRIEYQQTLQRGENGYSLRFPLITTPRMARQPKARGVRYARSDKVTTNDAARAPAVHQEEQSRTEPVSLQVRLYAGFPLGSIESPSHATEIVRIGETGALLTLRGERVPADRDFVVTWSPKETAEPAVQLFRQQFGMSEYLLAMVTPPSVDATLPRRPREVVFVVDTSGSMAGSTILQMRRALEDAILRLNAEDRFNIIAFDSTFEPLFEAPVPADEKGKAIATQFIDRLVASGATDLLRPLTAALKDQQPDSSRVRQVVMITDGSFAQEQKLLSEIAVRRGRSRLFLVGIGPVPRANLLRRAAEVGRGGHLHIASTHDVRDELDAFLRRLEYPTITDLKVAWPKELRAETLPDPLPDVYAGQPLVLVARSDSVVKGRITITGTLRGKPWRSEVDASAALDGHGVARLWARRKIASLESHADYARQDGGDVSSRIEKVALEHQLVSRMTRLVAFEKKPAPTAASQGLGLASENAPPAQPHGWVYSGAFDFAQDSLERRPWAGPRSENWLAMRTIIAPRIEAAPAIAMATTQEADQPQAADLTKQGTDDVPEQLAQAGQAPTGPGLARSAEPLFSARTGVIIIMAIVFAAMSALTLGLWRQFGRLHGSDQNDSRRGT